MDEIERAAGLPPGFLTEVKLDMAKDVAFRKYVERQKEYHRVDRQKIDDLYAYLLKVGPPILPEKPILPITKA